MKRPVPLFLFLAFSMYTGPLSAAPPVVSNVRAAQRPGTSLVDILYDVTDPDGNSPLRISFKVSSDAGATWTVPVFTYQGAVGPNVLPGNNRSIVWNAGMDWTGHFTSLCRVRVFADDGTVPPEKVGMVLIPAGTFQMGNNYSGAEGESSELPVHSVFVSAFYMETNEVTKALPVGLPRVPRVCCGAAREAPTRATCAVRLAATSRRPTPTALLGFRCVRGL